MFCFFIFFFCWPKLNRIDYNQIFDIWFVIIGRKAKQKKNLSIFNRTDWDYYEIDDHHLYHNTYKRKFRSNWIASFNFEYQINQSIINQFLFWRLSLCVCLASFSFFSIDDDDGSGQCQMWIFLLIFSINRMIIHYSNMNANHMDFCLFDLGCRQQQQQHNDIQKTIIPSLSLTFGNHFNNNRNGYWKRKN